MTSFAWGMAPSSARAQVSLTKLDGCYVSDADWNASVLKEVARDSDRVKDPDILTCNNFTDPGTVPRLLIADMMTSAARRLLDIRTGSISTPRVKVQTALTSSEYPPKFWLVSCTVCFPCDGQSVTRCLNMTALLDASNISRSRIVSANDAGMVPAEQAAGDVVPFNAQSRELIVQPAPLSGKHYSVSNQ